MKKQQKLYRSIISLIVATALLLSIPLVAMQFSAEVSWDLTDFVIMGALIFGTGLSYIMLSRSTPNFIYRTGVGLTIVTVFLMIWANLAVGLIGSGPNLGNLMYIGVILVLVIGVLFSHFRPAGMQRAAYATVLALAVHAAIVLLVNMQQNVSSSLIGLLCVNGFFAALFSVSGVLFHYAGRQMKHRQA